MVFPYIEHISFFLCTKICSDPANLSNDKNCVKYRKLGDKEEKKICFNFSSVLIFMSFKSLGKISHWKKKIPIVEDTLCVVLFLYICLYYKGMKEDLCPLSLFTCCIYRIYHWLNRAPQVTPLFQLNLALPLVLTSCQSQAQITNQILFDKQTWQTTYLHWYLTIKYTMVL